MAKGAIDTLIGFATDQGAYTRRDFARRLGRLTVELGAPQGLPEEVTNPEKFPIFALPKVGPVLNKTATIPNRTPAIVDSRDAVWGTWVRDIVKGYSDPRGWTVPVLNADENQFFYPYAPKDGTGEPDTNTSWGYSMCIAQAVGLSVIMKPGDRGQVWARLPENVPLGYVTYGFSVNPNFIGDIVKSQFAGAVPSIDIRTNPGAGIKVVYLSGDGTQRKVATGNTEDEMGSMMVHLATNMDSGERRGVTLVQIPLYTAKNRRPAMMIETSADYPPSFKDYLRITPADAKPF